MAEAAGLRVHVYTSPHLVRFNERIRIAGELVSDAALAAALEHVERVNAGAPITVFEVITAVAFHLFAATPADLCVLEVGLGGRGDATNVIARPAACAITSISLDHRELLGDTLAAIAAEKAGIMKPGVPVAIGAQPAEVPRCCWREAARVGAPVRLRGPRLGRGADAARLPLRGCARHARAAAAVAAGRVPVGQRRHRHRRAARVRAWRCRMRRSAPASPPRNGRRGCNACAAGWRSCCRRSGSCGWTAATIPAPAWCSAEHLRGWADRPVHLIVGMKQSKDSEEFLRPLLPLAATLWAVAEPGTSIGAAGRGDRRGLRRRGAARAARRRCAARDAARTGPARVLICGSLYLAGEVLQQDV